MPPSSSTDQSATFIDQLNDQQRAAVTHRGGALLVLAGAGSGKTRVVIERAAWLVASGVSPHHILAVTFTNKAVGEMRSRLSARGLMGASVSTFHSWGLQILRQYLVKLRPDADGALHIYDQSDAEKILKAILEQRGERPTPALTSRLREFISQMKNRLLTPQEAGESRDAQERQFAVVYADYQNRLEQCKAIDLDDLLFETIRLWRQHPDICQQCQKRWSWLLIDEYQDTNRAQYEMVRMLAKEGDQLTAVGDPDQAIYSWRGADIANILRFESDFPNARVLRLEQNYRSTDRILKASQGLIEHNAQRLEKALWSAKGPGEKIAYFVAEKDLIEARFVASEVDRLKTIGHSLSDIAVFYRTHAQSRVLEDALLSQKIPYRIFGGISFYQRKEIKDILALLKLMQFESDTVSFLRAITSPKRGLGKATLDAIIASARLDGKSPLKVCRCLVNGQLVEGVKLGSKQRASLEQFLKLIDELKQLAQTATVARLLSTSIEKSEYLQWIKERDDAFEERKENLDALIAKALQWQEDRSADQLDPNDLSAFLEEISLNASAGEKGEEAADSLFMMTLHNSKGLEFKTVFLTGMEEDLFPHARARDDKREMEEERRLCYVGMTRAKTTLIISRSKFRLLWGQWRFMLPSRFLREIPQIYLTRL